MLNFVHKFVMVDYIRWPNYKISNIFEIKNKVENESLRKELEEKQSLLCQASQAMEMMESEHKKQSHEAQMIIDDLNHRIESMTVSQTSKQFLRFFFIDEIVCTIFSMR